MVAAACTCPVHGKGNVEPVQDIEQDADWTEGDFTIISSDSVRFKVQSYFVLAASTVLRSAGEVAKSDSPVIHLTDDTLETAVIVRRFLQLITSGLASGYLYNGEFYEVKSLIGFLQKWDCNPATALFVYKLHMATPKTHNIDVFLLGAIAGADDICTARLSQALTWTPNNDNWGTAEQSIWNPAHWGKNMFTYLPVDYITALARTWGEVGGHDPIKSPEVFKRRLQELKSPAKK